MLRLVEDVLRSKPVGRVAWTLYGLVQPYIDVYLSQETFEAVRRSFPYLISEKYASGGGDVMASSPLC